MKKKSTQSILRVTRTVRLLICFGVDPWYGKEAQQQGVMADNVLIPETGERDLNRGQVTIIRGKTAS
jgi:hypothetical protein